ncbi:hypothetical protein [Clostridium chrysemydis]|uniref:hypothetical protein n=1 Tax=Clostridium chrysemydis TaxID=2665504 RepID=UPI00188459EC|nr:hypothetical protein [Clostridium chrysemydis]
MYAVYYNLEDSNIGNVYMYHKTQSADLGTEVNYAIVEKIPDPEYRAKMMARLLINLETKELYYEYIERQLTREEELEQEVKSLRQELMRLGS